MDPKADPEEASGPADPVREAYTLSGKHVVYNLEVEGFHTYSVGRGRVVAGELSDTGPRLMLECPQGMLPPQTNVSTDFGRWAVVMLDELIAELESLQSQHEPNYVQKFDAVLARVAELDSSAMAPAVLRFLDDSNPHQEAMFSIIHLVETLDDASYVAEILRATGQLAQRSPRWTAVLYMRMLNSDETRTELVRQVAEADAELKGTVRGLMARIAVQSGSLVARTAEVAKAAS